jgi:hypothetical protein
MPRSLIILRCFGQLVEARKEGIEQEETYVQVALAAKKYGLPYKAICEKA